MLDALQRIYRDEAGGETTEYAIVLGLVVVAAVAIISQIGPRVLASWAVIEQKLDGQDDTVIVITPPTEHH